MPAGDRTGPMGAGPMTGRGMGYCSGYAQPGFFMNPMPGRGRGMGRGMGWGRGRGFGIGWGRGWRRRVAEPGGAPWPYGFGPGPLEAGDVPVQPETELEMLVAQADRLEAGLAEIRERIQSLESTKTEG